MHPLIPYFEPFSFPLGPVAIHGFGILVAAGFLLGGNLAQKKAEDFTKDPKAGDRVNRLVGWLVVATFVGGHFGDVLFYRPHDLAKDPMLLFRVWEGLSSFGGFSVCVPLTIWFFRKERVNAWPYLDALAIGFSLGWFFGRMGCFSAHDHPGGITQFWLGVPGMCPDEVLTKVFPLDTVPTPEALRAFGRTVACHDLGLYEGLWSGAVFLLFMLLARKPRFQGFFVAWLAVLYGPMRFCLDFFRSAPIDVRYGGFTPAQYGSVVVSILGVWMLATRSRKAAAVAAKASAAP